MLAFCALAPLLDVSSKLAAHSIPVGQITGARFVVQGALMLPIALFMGTTLPLDRRMAGLIFLRAVFLILSTYTFVAGIAIMPVADALAIAFVEPFILLILGSFLFGDIIGPRRIAACAVGFGGALMVIQPSLAAFGTIALYPLGTAFFFAFYMLITRHMSRSMHPVAMQLHTSLAGSAICLPVLWLLNGTGIPSLDAVQPQGIAWLWLFGVGFWAALSHICMTYALKFAPTSTLAPLHYLEIVAAVVLGYLVFSDFPNAMTWAGIIVIVSSGLYIIQREHRVARDAARAISAPTH
ncbi:MAG: DMT family transporter [Rhodoferax sp.]|nr:DMT family transporter [Pseudorhodobacter sp.]